MRNKYDVIILCGGEGSRLKKFINTPKCLIPIDNNILLFHQFDRCLTFGIKKIIVSININQKILFKSYIDKYLKKNSNHKPIIKIITEKNKLGTGGAIINALKFMNKRFFIIFGDIYHIFNFKELLNFHMQNPRNGTLVCQPNGRPEDSDQVFINEENIIKDISIYPHLNLDYSHVSTSAIMIIEKKSLVKLNIFNISLFLLIKNLINKGNEFNCYLTHEFLKDIGTINRLNKTNYQIYKKIHYKNSLLIKNEIYFFIINDPFKSINYNFKKIISKNLRKGFISILLIKKDKLSKVLVKNIQSILSQEGIYFNDINFFNDKKIYFNKNLKNYWQFSKKINNLEHSIKKVFL